LEFQKFLTANRGEARERIQALHLETHEGKAKAKERREVGEGDDTIIVEDTTDDDDDDEEEETLQDRFQLRSRFSRPGLPHVPLVQDPPTSLEASLAAPPRKPRNPARKRVTKKLKVSETTPQEVRCLD
jgi:hypothetical protein